MQMPLRGLEMPAADLTRDLWGLWGGRGNPECAEEPEATVFKEEIQRRTLRCCQLGFHSALARKLGTKTTSSLSLVLLA